MTTLGERISCLSENAPESTALIAGEVRISFAELAGFIAAMKGYLLENLPDLDSPISISVESNPKCIITILAAIELGCGYLPINLKVPEHRLLKILELHNIDTIFLANAKTTLSSSNKTVLDMGKVSLQTLPELPELSRRVSVSDDCKTKCHLENGIAYVLHTSGSTGAPKAVEMSQAAIENLINWQIEQEIPQSKPRTLQLASLTFDVSFQEIFTTILSRGTLYLSQNNLLFDTISLVKFIEKNRIQRIFLPANILHIFAETAISIDGDLSSLVLVVCAGDQLKITPAIRQMFLNLKACRLQNQYGPTETHVVTYLELSGDPNQWPHLPSIGHNLPFAEIDIVDEEGKVISQSGKSGEICVSGVCLANGYRKQPTLTKTKFINNLKTKSVRYHTGDIGKYNQYGEIDFLGRIDDQVKIDGFRVELGDLEALLLRHSSVLECAASFYSEASGAKRMVAFIVARNSHNFSESTLSPSTEALTAEIFRYLKEHAAAHMVPSSVVIMDVLPRNENGKVLRRLLPIPNKFKRNLTTTPSVPRTKVETIMTKIWIDILNVDVVGIDDDFFDLGGNSAKVVVFINALNDEVNKRISVASFLESPTIRKIADNLESPKKQQFRRVGPNMRNNAIRRQLGIRKINRNIPRNFNSKKGSE